MFKTNERVFLWVYELKFGENSIFFAMFAISGNFGQSEFEAFILIGHECQLRHLNSCNTVAMYPAQAM